MCFSSCFAGEDISDLRDMAGPPEASLQWSKDVLRSTGPGSQHSTLVSQHKGPVASVEPAMPSRQESWAFLIHVSFPLKKKQYKA